MAFALRCPDTTCSFAVRAVIPRGWREIRALKAVPPAEASDGAAEYVDDSAGCVDAAGSPNRSTVPHRGAVLFVTDRVASRRMSRQGARPVFRPARKPCLPRGEGRGATPSAGDRTLTAPAQHPYGNRP